MHILCWNRGDFSKNNIKHDGGKYRLNYKPKGPENRLFILRNKISSNKQQNQISISPQFVQANIKHASLRGNHLDFTQRFHLQFSSIYEHKGTFYQIT